MSPWEKLLERPHVRGHFVQLYEADDGGLVRNVGLYLWEGLRRGEGVLVIATPEHEKLFREYLDSAGAGVSGLVAGGQLVFFDAQQLLAQFMVAGQPNWERFEKLVCAAMRQLRPVNGADGLRAYGEMVGILWKARQFASAIRLEQLWNKLLERASFSLYCAYAIDIFGKEFDAATLHSVLCAHTHLLPSQPGGTLEAALHQAMDEVLGRHGPATRERMQATCRPGIAVMPTAEAIVFWLRKNLPHQADRILAQARRHYQLSTA